MSQTWLSQTGMFIVNSDINTTLHQLMSQLLKIQTSGLAVAMATLLSYLAGFVTGN